MARHLFIGNGAAAAIVDATKLATDGCIALQTENNALFSVFVADTSAAETAATSPSFRVVQGTAGNNIVSPWIVGKNIISVTGTMNVAAVAHTAKITATGSSTAAGFVNLKFVRKGGTHPEFFHLTVAAPLAVNTADALGILIFNAYNAASKPDWLATTCTEADALVTFSGAKNSATWEGGLVPFAVILEENTVGTTTFPIVNDFASAVSGTGVGYDLLKLEKEHQGINSGFYNRIFFPNAPATAALGAAAYDIITIVATKDGSTTSSINGVDNLIQIDIAVKEMANDTVIDALQLAINAYTTGLGFAAIDATA
tara:strand:- start:3062 stop:4003 length:942 start_codon:yes stop_codon:yes gene_type:complete